MIEPKTLKGFRDFLPETARKRQYVISTLRQVFESFGFDPLETPALEYEEILTGKYGEEGDKLMYRFEDNGKRKVALRYDQTVPLARVVAQYGSASSPQGNPLLPLPFKRYQIQPVWRAENTQKGRYREFVQCDIDIVGTPSPLADAESIATAYSAYQKLGFSNIKILVNDRTLFEGLSIEAIIIIDKLKKIGVEAVLKQLVEKNLAETIDDASEILSNLQNAHPTQRLEEIFSYLTEMGINNLYYEFSPTLARGLDYYTSTIFEVECADYPAGSLGGGGRFDTLIGMFGKQDIPAVGFAFGFDRTIEAMEELKLFPQNLSSTKVLVTIFSPLLKDKSVEISSILRSNNIPTELYLDETTKMEKQLKYANQKQIPYVVIIGPDEAEKKMATLKNMQTGQQTQLSIENLPDEVI